MEIHSYNKEFQIANLLFKRLFNNISVVENGKEIKFNCVLGNRSRILKGIENTNRDAMYRLPLIVIERTGITKNNERISNINNEVKYQVRSGLLNYNLYTPVPIDISYKVSIMSKYQKHIDIAVSNILPFFNKDLFVRSEHPKFEGVYITNQVIMEDSIEEDHPSEIDPNADDITTCTLGFIFKTQIFCGTEKSSADCKIIRKISTMLSVDEETQTSTEVSVITDTEYEGFVPTIKNINVGFYPIPLLSSYIPHMDWVDSLCSQGYDERPYVDRFIWKIDESGNLYQEGSHYVPYPILSDAY